MRLKEKEERIKSQIIEYLQEVKFGVSVKAIEDKILLSRNTVLKYLEILKKEGKVHEWNIGKYHIWLHRDSFQYINDLKSPQDYAIFHLFKEMLSRLQNLKELKNYDWKQLGFDIGKQESFTKHFSQDMIAELKTQNVQQQEAFELFANQYPSFLQNLLYMLGDPDVSIDLPIINEEPPFIIFRIRNSSYATNQAFFEILCGIEEADLTPEISRHFNQDLEISIHRIHPVDRVIDLKFAMKN